MLVVFQTILTIVLPILSVFLILLILVQRGRGGGLVGAFGGMGGQSAFGAKAGDVFTRITVVTVCFWIAICTILLVLMKPGDTAGSGGFGGRKTTNPPVVTMPAGSVPAGSATTDSATMPTDSNVTIPIPAETP